MSQETPAVPTNATPAPSDDAQPAGVSIQPKRAKSKSAKKTVKVVSGGKKIFSPVRWTIARAASEFRIHPRTLAQRVKAAGKVPSKDRRFSTAEIHACICGDYERERTRKMVEDADNQALRNARERRQLADKADLLSRFEGVYLEMKQAILNSSMSETEKDVILTNLAKLHEK